eukprot:scaffold4561_cov184-Alexandrium_tamarense.AAC.14
MDTSARKEIRSTVFNHPLGLQRAQSQQIESVNPFYPSLRLIVNSVLPSYQLSGHTRSSQLVHPSLSVCHQILQILNTNPSIAVYTLIYTKKIGTPLIH